MTHATKRILHLLSTLPHQQRRKLIKIVLQIIANILNNPTDKQYHYLNLQILLKKQNQTCIELLILAGFHRSENDKKLIFNPHQTNHLQMVKKTLLQYTSHSQNSSSNYTHKNHQRNTVSNEQINQMQSTTNELINAGFTEYEARLAIQQSLNNTNQHNNTQNNDDQKYPSSTLPNNKSIIPLIDMGFNANMAYVAMAFCNNDMNQAVQFLLSDKVKNSLNCLQSICQPQSISTDRCPNIIRECPYLINLRKQRNIINHKSDNNIEIVDTLNNFHHLISNHSTNNEFNIIYQMFGGPCLVKNCAIIKRHYRDRNDHSTKYNCKTPDHNQIAEIFDQIHCHFRHQYDIGTRLTETERMQIDDHQDANVKLINLHNILQNKKEKLLKLTNSKVFKNNKFATTLCQSKVDNNNALSPLTIPKYSYSFPFVYLEKFQHLKSRNYENLRYSDLYVPCKFQTLKEELTFNNICCIDIETWNNKMAFALTLQKTQNAKKCWAKTQKYMNTLQYLIEHPIRCGYSDGTPITEKHLIVLLIYCSLDKLQEKISQTYRKMFVDETLKDVVARHSNYYHFGKYIKESVEIFGTEYKTSTVKRMYHGINREIMFTGLVGKIHGPLSTTYEWNIAVQFSAKIGMVVELVPEVELKHFCCEWLSPYANEGELLFVGGLNWMNFCNIVDTKRGYDFKEYIQALRVLDNMTWGGDLMYNDPADVHKVLQYQTLDVAVLKLPKFGLLIKRICIALIHHELNRNGYETHKYHSYNGLSSYIDQLFHQICVHKQIIAIDWKSMHIDVLKKCCLLRTGFIGYSFLKSIFCPEHYEGINLKICGALFPNLVRFKVLNLSGIDSQFLDEILVFLTNSRITDCTLTVAPEYGVSNIEQQIVEHKQTFENNGLTLMCGSNVPGHQGHVLQICSLKYYNDTVNDLSIPLSI